MPGASGSALGTAIVDAVRGVVGNDWLAIRQGTTEAATELASVAVDLANPLNTMTPDEKAEVMGDQSDSLKNAILFGQTVTKVVAKQAVDAALQAVVTALPALAGIA